ncbi:L-aspartate oxidase, partial [Desulfotalea psychrophila]|nr:L-aspartate oxidase [Desulfotalea psychrophila]
GSGIAGLSFALKCAELGTVVVVTKKKDVDTATNLAQGGIAAVLEGNDSVAAHVGDTILSGAGLCDEAVVRLVVESGPDRIAELVAYGVDFVRDQATSSGYSLGREGGHSHRRVAHAYDLTGREIERALLEKVREHSQIHMYEEHVVVDLLLAEGEIEGWKGQNGKMCVGAYVMEGGKVKPYRAKMTVLCTGGAGKVYLYTTNPDIATGDGIAMAFRAGASVQNMEFVQFHPTCLFHPLEKNFLISEAVRGEGGVLVGIDGVPFMGKYDERKDLATRDTVARAIDRELKETGEDCVFLDISHREPEYLKKRFPTIYKKCLSRGIDITKDKIPVVPAAHYVCGGVKTDTLGRSTVPGLLVLGETACTGLHGGNRLASNSLLEAVVFAHRAAKYCTRIWPVLKEEERGPVDAWISGNARKLSEEILINHNWDSIRRLMWNYVGIVRSMERLALARKRMEFICAEIDQHYRKYIVTPNMVELRNISQVAMLIIQSAMQRKESRGLHYLIEYPGKTEQARQTVVRKKNDGLTREIEILEGKNNE